MSEIKRIGIDNLKPDRNHTRRFVQSDFHPARPRRGWPGDVASQSPPCPDGPLLPQASRPALAVALANKMARIAWAMMKSGEAYRHSRLPTQSPPDRRFVTLRFGVEPIPRQSIGDRP
jgi:hypothetical protein